MGKRGPSQTPSRVLQLRGTFRKDRHGNPETEPKFELLTEMPPPPVVLDGIGRFEWHRVGPELIAKQLLADVDLAAFTLYCMNVSRVIAAERVIMDEGLTTWSNSGAKAHPAVMIARQAGAEVRKFAQEFGMTPSARTRVKAVEGSGDDKPAATDPWGKLAGGAS